jgi:hypothetical protein
LFRLLLGVIMTSKVTVITATIPGREELLERARKSVGEQTVQPHAHLMKLDVDRDGGAVTKNRLSDFVDTEWFMVLDDDDTLLPNHIETLLRHSDNADVVYSYAEGNDRYNRPYSMEELMRDSIVSHTAIIRTSFFRKLGGFPVESGYDWLLWKAAAAGGARFVCVPEKTWHYDLDLARPHESLGGLPWASENA